MCGKARVSRSPATRRPPFALRGLWPAEVSARRYLQLAVGSLAVLFLVVTSGAFVRLTASGLGCDNWPRCGDKPYPETGYHAFVEFGNRLVALVGIVLTLVTWLAARKVDPARLSPIGRRMALAAMLGAVAQIPLGGVTVILELHPVAVMMHFFLALAVVACAAVAVLEGLPRAPAGAGPVGPGWWRRLALAGVPAAAVLVVSGAVATAAGPHSGGEDIRRLGVAVNDAVYVHVRVSAVFGIGLLLIGIWLLRHRSSVPGLARLGGLLLAATIAQAILGEVQYRNAIPWGMVLAHVFLAATIWTLVVVVVWLVWRPRSLVYEAGAAGDTVRRQPAAVR